MSVYVTFGAVVWLCRKTSQQTKKQSRVRETMEGVIGLVINNDDLLLSIFELGGFSPIELVALERVCVQWRRVYHANARGLVQSATPSVVTKTILMGLYALSSSEANILPHVVRARQGGGFMRLYTGVGESAWTLVGNEIAWEARLARRGASQVTVERAFGAEWRRTRWLPYRRPSQSTR